MPERGVLRQRQLFSSSLMVAGWKFFVASPTPVPTAGLGRIPLAAYNAGVVWFERMLTLRGPLRDFIGEWLVGMDVFQTGSVAKSINVLSVEGPP